MVCTSGGEIEKNKNNPDRQDNIEQLKDLQKDLPTEDQDMKNIIPEDSLEVMKTNDWKDIDPVTGAAGVYQFTEDQWNELAEANPSLGLTDNGRVSENSSEQEKAMEQSLQDNAKGLTAYQIPVTNANLYGTHRFGLDDYVAVLMSTKNEKLTDIVENSTLFEGFKTIKSVKDHVKRKVKKNK